jgi:sugar lactone lactonase YvrE
MSHAGRLKFTLAGSQRWALAGVVAVGALCAGWAYAQAPAPAPNSQPNPYRGIENFFQLPEGRKIGSTAAIDIDRDGSSIWVFERCGAAACDGSSLAPLLKFDSSGKVVKSLGAGMFVYPHGIHVDREGNIWVADGRAKDGKGQQVLKLNQDGKVLLTLGKAGVTGTDPDTFNGVSDIAVAPNGDIFVSDGHGGETNARIMKYSKDGKFIKTWGKKGSGPGEFDTPHNLAFDSKGRLFVADRANSRIQIFDQDGKFLEQWKQFGRPSGIYIDKNDTLYSADSESDDKRNPGWKRGIRIGSAKDGKVTGFIPDPDPNGSQEGVAADAKGNIYGSLTGGMALKKYVKASGTQ